MPHAAAAWDRSAGGVGIPPCACPAAHFALPPFGGTGPPMANQIVMNSVMFTVFNGVKDAANESTQLNENAAPLVAGLVSGFATACISTPADWFKIKAQLSLANITNNI